MTKKEKRRVVEKTLKAVLALIDELSSGGGNVLIAPHLGYAYQEALEEFIEEIKAIANQIAPLKVI